MGDYYSCRISYDKVDENGLSRKALESYVVEADSFGDAENRIKEELASYISSEVIVEDVSKTLFKEVFVTDDGTGDRWYKARLAFITFDERTKREKHSIVNYLVQGNTINEAVKNIDSVLGKTMFDYQSMSVQYSAFVDVMFAEK